jgi:hypothetical protein
MMALASREVKEKLEKDSLFIVFHKKLHGYAKNAATASKQRTVS